MSDFDSSIFDEPPPTPFVDLRTQRSNQCKIGMVTCSIFDGDSGYARQPSTYCEFHLYMDSANTTLASARIRVTMQSGRDSVDMDGLIRAVVVDRESATSPKYAGYAYNVINTTAVRLMLSLCGAALIIPAKQRGHRDYSLERLLPALPLPTICAYLTQVPGGSDCQVGWDCLNGATISWAMVHGMVTQMSYVGYSSRNVASCMLRLMDKAPSSTIFDLSDSPGDHTTHDLIEQMVSDKLGTEASRRRALLSWMESCESAGVLGHAYASMLSIMAHAKRKGASRELRQAYKAYDRYQVNTSA